MIVASQSDNRTESGRRSCRDTWTKKTPLCVFETINQDANPYRDVFSAIQVMGTDLNETLRTLKR